MEPFHNFVAIDREKISTIDQLVGRRTRRLYEWWSSFGEDVPLRGQFDIAEHWDLSSHVFLALRDIDQDCFRYRLVGEDAINIVGKNYTGIDFCCDDEDPNMADLARYYTRVAEARVPMCSRGQLDMIGVFSKDFFEGVDCPLVNEAGEVTHIIGVLEKLVQRK